MTLAARPAEPPRTLTPIPASTALPQAETAVISTIDGRYITGGLADIGHDGSCWSATIRALDRPGVVASMYFVDGIREVMLKLPDGRAGRGRITGTSFVAASQRICQLQGLEPLR